MNYCFLLFACARRRLHHRCHLHYQSKERCAFLHNHSAGREAGAQQGDNHYRLILQSSAGPFHHVERRLERRRQRNPNLK
nr:MAG TPA: hypothetical protein [Caudoviricetes sp.]